MVRTQSLFVLIATIKKSKALSHACMQAGADHHHQNSKNRKESTPKKPLPFPSPPKKEKKKKRTHTLEL
jgi:hypothetical protein